MYSLQVNYEHSAPKPSPISPTPSSASSAGAVDGMWGDEVVHGPGLGITGVPAAEGTVVNPREEELRGIWERESVSFGHVPIFVSIISFMRYVMLGN